MELNGKDYTIQTVMLLTIVVLFFLQYVLCKKAKNPWIRAIPFLAPLAALIGAAACALSPAGGFMDFRMLGALLCGIYAIICLVPILIARFVYRRKHSRRMVR